MPSVRLRLCGPPRLPGTHQGKSQKILRDAGGERSVGHGYRRDGRAATATAATPDQRRGRETRTFSGLQQQEGGLRFLHETVLVRGGSPTSHEDAHRRTAVLLRHLLQEIHTEAQHAAAQEEARVHRLDDVRRHERRRGELTVATVYHRTARSTTTNAANDEQRESSHSGQDRDTLADRRSDSSQRRGGT